MAPLYNCFYRQCFKIGNPETTSCDVSFVTSTRSSISKNLCCGKFKSEFEMAPFIKDGMYGKRKHSTENIENISPNVDAANHHNVNEPQLPAGEDDLLITVWDEPVVYVPAHRFLERHRRHAAAREGQAQPLHAEEENERPVRGVVFVPAVENNNNNQNVPDGGHVPVVYVPARIVPTARMHTGPVRRPRGSQQDGRRRPY